MRCVYIYPLKNPENSFHIAGREYIQALSKLCDVEEVDEGDAREGKIPDGDLIFVHPFFYNAPFLYRHLGDRKVVGVDVADSDRLSAMAVDYANRMARSFVVPSNFSAWAYKRSGIKARVVVWPHALPEEWWSPKSHSCPDVPEREEGALHILFFWLHSHWRKGVDVLYVSLLRLRDMGVRFKLWVKARGDIAPLHVFDHVKIDKFLDTECLMALYEAADVVALPSRGGGFERNGLEALARGTPVVAPQVGSWVEYFPPWLAPRLLAAVERFEVVLPNNPIHVGVGPRADPTDFALKIMMAPELKPLVAASREWLYERFSIRALERRVRETIHLL